MGFLTIKAFIMKLAKRRGAGNSLKSAYFPETKILNHFCKAWQENANTIEKDKSSKVVTNPFILNRKNFSALLESTKNNTCSRRWKLMLIIMYSDDAIYHAIDHCSMHAHSFLKFNFRGRDFSAYQIFMACFDWLLYFSSNTCWLLVWFLSFHQSIWHTEFYFHWPNN